MSKFAQEIHTFDPGISRDTRRLDGVQVETDADAPTTEIPLEDMDTSAGVIPKMPTDQVKAERLARAMRAVHEYENDPPRSTKNEATTQPFDWRPSSPELRADIEKVDFLQAALETAAAKGASSDALRKQRDKIEAAAHAAGMAEMQRASDKYIGDHPVVYRTEQNAIDPTRPDLWTKEQRANFPKLVYALHQQGQEYKLSADIPPEKRAVFDEVIAKVKAGMYNAENAEKAKENVAVAFISGLARVVSKMRRRGK